MSTVIEGVQIETPKHPNYKRVLSWKNETGFRYVFHHAGDVNREFILSVMIFDVPGEVLDV